MRNTREPTTKRDVFGRERVVLADLTALMVLEYRNLHVPP